MTQPEWIPVAGPSITDAEVKYVADAAQRCWGAEANYYHERFERTFAEYVGCKHAIAVTHCTSALHLSLAALGIGPGDEVIVPDATWIASVAPVSYVGATPVFADVDPQTWCLSAESFAACITERTKAVIAVDLYGSMPDFEQIRAIADERGIAVIEDAAEAFGSARNGTMAGAFGDTGVFSFHGSKTMTTGEGGMLVTDRDDLRDRVLFLRDHGRVPGDVSFFNQEVAFKYRMSSLQAAMGLAQVERAEQLVETKRTIFGWYHDQLKDEPRLQLNSEPPGVRNSYWMVTLVPHESLGTSKEQLMAFLKERGIDSRPFFHPLSSIPAFARHPSVQSAAERNVHSYSVSKRGVNLPSGQQLKEADVDRICCELRNWLAAADGRQRSAA